MHETQQRLLTRRRLFFAVTLPDTVGKQLKGVQNALRAEMGERGIRWEASEKLHITLKFLGETTEQEVRAAIAAAQAVAGQSAPFPLSLAGIGVFPGQRRPQTLWVGVTEEIPLLTRLAELLDSALAQRGFAPEVRPFHPHVTLARTKTPEGQEAVAKTLAASDVGRNKVDTFDVIQVESFVLMRSELRPYGSIYTVLETFPLPSL